MLLTIAGCHFCLLSKSSKLTLMRVGKQIKLTYPTEHIQLTKVFLTTKHSLFNIRMIDVHMGNAIFPFQLFHQLNQSIKHKSVGSTLKLSFQINQYKWPYLR